MSRSRLSGSDPEQETSPSFVMDPQKVFGDTVYRCQCRLQPDLLRYDWIRRLMQWTVKTIEAQREEAHNRPMRRLWCV